jgi:hypothetical protein
VAGPGKRLSIAWAIFGAGAVVSIALILIGSRQTVFSGDELGILYRLADLPLHQALFEPPAEKYLIAVPTLVYGALAETLGAGSYVPYRILGALLVALAAGLFFAVARRRAPEPLALGCSILLLFFGAAAEVVAIPGRVPGQIAVCAGLGILLALDRADRRGDAIACALGVVALASHPIGLAFVAAAAVVIAFGRRWSRLWVVLVPIVLYGLWWVTLRDPGGELTATSGEVTAFARDAFIAVCAALTGIFRGPWTDEGDFLTTASRIIAVLAVLGAAIAVIRARRVSAGLLAALVALAVGLVGPALAPGGIAFGFRNPEAARYLYPASILTLLVLVELVGLRRGEATEPGWSWASVAIAAAGAAVFVIAMSSNVAQLTDGSADYRAASTLVSAQFGAFDEAREGRSAEERAAELGESVEQSSGWLALMLGFSNPDGVDKVALGSPAYYAIKDAYGLPSSDEAELAEAPADVIEQTDRVLVVSYPLTLEAETATPPGCDGPEAGADEAAPLTLPGGGLSITAGEGDPPAVTVGRFSGMAVQPLAWPAEARTASLALPDTVPGAAPWQVLVAGARSLRRCQSPPGP